MEHLSKMARSLWAKKSKNGDLAWLPLAAHMADSAAVAHKLWNYWLPDGVKQSINAGITPPGCAEHLFVFLAAVHDLGKATPVFQTTKPASRDLDERTVGKIKASGLPIEQRSYFSSSSKTPHALATQILLEFFKCDRGVAVVLGSHHGKPPGNPTLNTCGITSFPENFHLGRKGKEAWLAVQQELLKYALAQAGFSSIEEVPRPSMAAQVLLSGLVIMADWIASAETYFPYIGVDSVDYSDAKSRAEYAWASMALPYPWQADNLWMRSDLCRERFPFPSNTMQSVVAQVAATIQTPGILVLEAPMGGGKTEAALVAAEIFAFKAKHKGVFFALPTQATSDGIFPRLLQWVKKLDSQDFHSLRLVHGKAQFNETYQNLKGGVNVGEDEEGSVIVHDWFEGRKRELLDDFVVGTIDQLLLAALKQKHVMLRHLGLANKIVIIDECHAYDAYMSQYLNMALSWLGAYQVPVVVLSATLPAKKRKELIDSYRNAPLPNIQADPLRRNQHIQQQPEEWTANCAYPLITYTDGYKVEQKVVPAGDMVREVQLEFLADEALVDKLDCLLSGGGCAGVVVNTVKRAQELAGKLSASFDKETVLLLHSRFLAPDRAQKEKRLLELMGKPDDNQLRPEKCIVLGTQVLEQSLDIDFDVLITDICPMDLLLQRIGRLHRHNRRRPEKLQAAVCLITGLVDDGFEAGTQSIYGKYLLMRTKASLPPRLVLPQDISKLVHDVYNDEYHPLPESQEYSKARAEHKKLIADKEKRAKDFRIGPPWPEGDLRGWLETDVPDVSGKVGEAAVRDSDESIEVLLIQKDSDGGLRFPHWIENGHKLAQHEVPQEEDARALARCSVRLPSVLCAPWNIGNTIRTLEEQNKEQLSVWQKSRGLAGELFLVLDENYSAQLCDYRLTYDQYLGLRYERRENADVQTR